MKKQPMKKKQGIYQIHGLNGCSNIIGEKNLKIIRIDIMIGGNAEKKIKMQLCFQMMRRE